MRLRQACENAIYSQALEILNTYDDLKRCLQPPKKDTLILIILAGNLARLNEIEGLRDYLTDVRTLLVLPDRGPVTLSVGHTFYPRYISYVDSDFDDVAAVLRKMAAH